MSNHSILAIVTVEFMQTELSDQHLEYAVQEDRKYRGRRGGGGGAGEKQSRETEGSSLGSSFEGEQEPENYQTNILNMPFKRIESVDPQLAMYNMVHV